MVNDASSVALFVDVTAVYVTTVLPTGNESPGLWVDVTMNAPGILAVGSVQ